MGTIIALANQKGGVGKTTSCINIAASLAYYGRPVLLVDLDPQGNATMGCGIDKQSLKTSIFHVLVDDVPANRVIHKTVARVDVLPSNRDLTAAEVQLLNLPRKEFRLAGALSRIQAQYDFILIDCPPSLNMLTVNGLVAADSVLITLPCEYYALEGLTGLLETIEQLKAKTNPKLEIKGLLRTMYDPRSTLTTDVSEQLFAHFGDKVFQTVIPRNVRLAEAPSFGMPGILYDKHASGTKAYLRLAEEWLEIERDLTTFSTAEEEATA